MTPAISPARQRASESNVGQTLTAHAVRLERDAPSAYSRNLRPRRHFPRLLQRVLQIGMSRPFPLKVLLPLALGVIVSIAILVFSEFGYRRLDVANRQSTTALETQARLNDVIALVVDAEAGQRGYLLTGDPSYLEPYKNATQKLDPALLQLREAVAKVGNDMLVPYLGKKRFG